MSGNYYDQGRVVTIKSSPEEKFSSCHQYSFGAAWWDGRKGDKSVGRETRFHA